MNEAQEARDEGIARVSSPNAKWMGDALDAISAIQGGLLTGEDIRLKVGAYVGQPTHHNAWGALIRTATARGLLAKTGMFRQMRVKQSHARITPVYDLARRN